MIPTTGPVTLTQLRTELGLGSTPFSSFKSLAAVKQALGVTSVGTIRLSDLRGVHVVRASGLKQTLTSLMGNPSTVRAYRAVVLSSVAIGSDDPTVPALRIGQFPSGSSLELDVYGSVDGAGGQYNIAAGAGGTAIDADYPNQTVHITYRTGCNNRGGGGAGGKGGNGGPGGQGGPASGTSTSTAGPNYSRTAPVYYALYDQASDTWTYFWNGSSVSDGGGITYAASGAVQSTSGNPALGTQKNWYAIVQTTTVSGTGTAGGAGGAGGVGGNGGRGQGSDGAAAAGAVGANGSTGVNPGGGAGQGGTGGKGGDGGYGSGWGGTGQAGSGGNTGSTGTSGSGGAGQAGSGGAAGSAGGAAGRFLSHNGRWDTVTTTAESGANVLGDVA